MSALKPNDDMSMLTLTISLLIILVYRMEKGVGVNPTGKQELRVSSGKEMHGGQETHKDRERERK